MCLLVDLIFQDDYSLKKYEQTHLVDDGITLTSRMYPVETTNGMHANNR